MFPRISGRRIGSIASAAVCVLLIAASSPGEALPALKQHSAFYSTERIGRIRSNLMALPNGAALQQQAMDRADYWLRLSDEETWGLMFGPTIRRSWMVWSNGKCPACTNDVVMYEWKINAQKHPWKTQCPHCKEFFPKNDFGAFYRSGLDARGVFDPKLAARKLLYNQEHPGENDPLRSFGVDDGEGFVSGDKRWRFIGAYLVYGQFKQLIQEGIMALAEAWVLTGGTNYARRAGILLDRVADVYPDFDYAKQAFVYEKQGPAGYVSVWHDACEETRQMVLAYDQVFEGIRNDRALVVFLSAQARKHGLENSKESFAHIQKNIEERILRDALRSTAKMHSNFPRQEIAGTIIQSVLGWPENRAEVEKGMDAYIARATSVDGVTGEKGLAGYASYTIIGLAELLGEFSRADAGFLKGVVGRVPTLRQTWRFHVDTMCLDAFYPNSGDSGSYAKPINHYVGASFAKLTSPRLSPSMFTFFWQLYEATGDAAYVQMLYRENGDSLDGLPHDLCAPDLDGLRRGVKRVIETEGTRPTLRSVHKPGWHIGILRSGKGPHARAVSLDYDAGGAHGHFDGMTIGLFAMGADLLPDFGYPPVQHGGWSTPQVAWYLSPSAHNTVIVDGKGQRTGAGQCTLWADGEEFHVMRASAPALLDIQQFERTVALVDVSAEQFYVVDIFRVRNGSDHTKLVHGPSRGTDIGAFTTSGLSLSAAELCVPGAMMRSFRVHHDAPQGWRADWCLPSKNKGGLQGTLRYTDLTSGASAYTAEANVMPFNYNPPQGFWIPSLVVKRTGTAPLSSTFVSTLEAFESRSVIEGAVPLPARHKGADCTNGCVALKVVLTDGRSDVLIASADGHRAMEIEVEGNGGPIIFAGDMCQVRLTKEAVFEKVAVCRTSSLSAPGIRETWDPTVDLVEKRSER